MKLTEKTFVYVRNRENVHLNVAKSHQSIFENSPYNNRMRLKENIRFHLYISKGPCGDATTYGKDGASNDHPDR